MYDFESCLFHIKYRASALSCDYPLYKVFGIYYSLYMACIFRVFIYIWTFGTSIGFMSILMGCLYQENMCLNFLFLNSNMFMVILIISTFMEPYNSIHV